MVRLLVGQANKAIIRTTATLTTMTTTTAIWVSQPMQVIYHAPNLSVALLSISLARSASNEALCRADDNAPIIRPFKWAWAIICYVDRHIGIRTRPNGKLRFARIGMNVMWTSSAVSSNATISPWNFKLIDAEFEFWILLLYFARCIRQNRSFRVGSARFSLVETTWIPLSGRHQDTTSNLKLLKTLEIHLELCKFGAITFTTVDLLFARGNCECFRSIEWMPEKPMADARPGSICLIGQYLPRFMFTIGACRLHNGQGQKNAFCEKVASVKAFHNFLSKASIAALSKWLIQPVTQSVQFGDAPRLERRLQLPAR